MKRIVATAALCVALAVPAAALAGEEGRMKPFVLASKGPGEIARTVADTKVRLAAAGFAVAGSYSPYPDATVLVVTSDELKAAAAAEERFGAFGAVQRVTVTRIGDEVQVAWTNPRYMASAYQMRTDLAQVAAGLERALGAAEQFGPKDGKTAKELRGYHYMMGMPYFDEAWKLAAFPSQAAALEALEAGLAAGRGGTSKVYRVDVSPDASVVGVALTDGCGADAHVMKEIDFKPLRSTGHLPYEVVVEKGVVWALHAKFRIAVNFTDLSMMGDHSFMRIRCAPDSIEGALAAAARP
jgi:hypothetical protein